MSPVLTDEVVTTLSQKIGAFAAATTYDALPAAVVDSVRMRVLDTLGIVIAATPLETSRAARRWVSVQGSAGASTAAGIGNALPAHLAAFVNGVGAHSLDYDDTHLPSVLHPSASVVPAALAAAQANGSSGRELIAAIAVGLEVTVRLGMAGYVPEKGNSVFFEHGQHATSICGAMGSAVAAAMLFGSNVVDALGLAASMASGILESNRTGGTVKRMHCGWAAQSGVTAAQLVALGITGPPTVLEGRFGFFEAWLHGEVDLNAVADGLGESWSVPGIFFKPYPANHFTHAAIDAGAALRRAGITHDRIERLVLGVAAPTVRTIGEPIDVKRRPSTGYMAQFSGPYALVAGLLGGGGLEVSVADFADALAVDPLRRSLMDRVDVVADDRCGRIFPHQFPAIVTAHLTDGSTVVEEVLTNRGGPERPLSFEELSNKFRDNALDSLGEVETARLVEACAALEHQEDLTAMLAPLARIDLDASAPEN